MYNAPRRRRVHESFASHSRRASSIASDMTSTSDLSASLSAAEQGLVARRHSKDKTFSMFSILVRSHRLNPVSLTALASPIRLANVVTRKV